MDDDALTDRIAIGTSHRSPWSPVAIVALALLVLAGAAWSVSGGDDEPQPAAAPPVQPSPSIEPTPTPARSSRQGAMVTWGLRGPAVVRGRLAHTPDQVGVFPSLHFSSDGTQLYYASTASRMVALNHARGTERDLGPCPEDPCVASVSPDAEHIAYRDGRSLVVRSISDGELTVELPGISPFGPAWSPRGDRIAIAADDGLHVVDVDGTHLRTLLATDVTQSEFLTPAWSPDGGSIAYVITRPARSQAGGLTRSRFTVLTVDATTGAERILVRTGSCICSGQYAVGVAWSPNGRRVGFVVPGRTGVHTVPAAGGRVRTVSRVPSLGVLAWQPS